MDFKIVKPIKTLFYLGIAWFLYSLFVISLGSCSLEMKMTKDGKYDIFMLCLRLIKREAVMITKLFSCNL